VNPRSRGRKDWWHWIPGRMDKMTSLGAERWNWKSSTLSGPHDKMNLISKRE
jgi:hypothetical protein